MFHQEESNFSGRQIRYGVNDEFEEDVSYATIRKRDSSEEATLDNLIKCGRIKPGMCVKFKSCEFTKHYTEEMVGRDYDLQCTPQKGVVVQEGTDNFGIFSILDTRIVGEAHSGFEFVGRYGRAFMREHVEDLVKVFGTRIGAADIYIPTMENLHNWSTIDSFVLDCFSAYDGCSEHTIMDSKKDGKLLKVFRETLDTYVINFGTPSGTYGIYSIAIFISAQNLKCIERSCSSAGKVNDKPYSYKNSPYKTYIEVSG